MGIKTGSKNLLTDSEVLFCDNHLLVVNKPALLPTQDSPDYSTSLEEIAKQWIRKRFAKPGAVFLHAVHRLDASVSGIVLFARTSKALSRLNEQVRLKKFHKVYLALVEGTPSATSGTLEHMLLHKDRRACVVDPKRSKEAKKAILHFSILAQSQETSLLKIELDTGRYHQIRAQLAAIGCPICGDRKYDSHRASPTPGIALHHHELTFLHPITQESLSFQVPVPW